jgi:hypothetical protein
LVRNNNRAGSRKWYRDRFDMSIRSLLSCAPKEAILPHFASRGLYGNEMATAREMIERSAAEYDRLVAAVTKKPTSKIDAASSASSKALTRRLAAATRELIEALKLITPQTGATAA